MQDTPERRLSVHARSPRSTNQTPLACVNTVLCLSSHTGTDTPSTFSGCVVYALIHQNKFSQRWNDTQTAVTTNRPPQFYHSLNSPQSMESESPRRGQDIPSVSDLTTRNESTQQ